MTNITNEQLEAWAGLGPWEWCENWLYVANYNEHPGPVLWYTANDDGVHAEPHNAALIATAPDLARLVLEREKEIARLRFGLNGIANLIKTNIIENDGPNRFHLDGVSYEGPEVDAFFRILRGLEKIARQAMKETSDE